MTVAVQSPAERGIAPPGRWTVDARHSAVAFTVKHLMIASVSGSFREFEGALEVDRDGDVRAHGTIKVESLDTGALERDHHLLSPDFFDVDRYPEIRFLLLGFRVSDGDDYRALSELTIRGVTRQIVLEGSVLGPARDPWGEERLALDLEGQLSRGEFGLRWNELVDGSPVVGDKIRLAASLSLVRRSDWSA
jgi:polyisoprenoid-binding protein YceI